MCLINSGIFSIIQHKWPTPKKGDYLCRAILGPGKLLSAKIKTVYRVSLFKDRVISQEYNTILLQGKLFLFFFTAVTLMPQGYHATLHPFFKFIRSKFIASIRQHPQDCIRHLCKLFFDC